MKSKISFEKGIAGWLSLAALGLLVLLGATFHSVRGLLGANARVAHTFQVLETLEGAFSALKDAETGQRGFLLTGQNSYLEPYRDAQKVARQRFARAGDLTLDDPAQKRRLEALRPLVETKLAITRQSIEVRRRQGFAAAQKLLLAGRGKRVMDEIRREVAILGRVETALLAQGQAQSRAQLHLAMFIGGLSALAIPILLLVVYSLIRHQIQQRNAVETELRDKEAVLQGKQSFLDALLDNAGAGIVACDANGILTLFNRTTRAFHGLPVTPIPAADWAQKFDLYHGDGVTSLEKAEVPLFRALRGEAVSDAEMVIAPKNGAARTVSVNGQAIRDKNGQIVGAVAVMHDISARKAAEIELRESQLFAQSIAENSTSIIYLFDLDVMANVYANRDVTEFLGYSAPQVQAMGDRILPAIVHPDDLPFLLSHLASFQDKNDGEVVEFETRIRHASGDYRWIASREVIFKRHPDGTPWQILGNSHDITGRKEAAAQLQAAHDELEIRVARRTDALAQANDQLQETGDRLQAILDNATAVVYLKDLQGRYLLINHQFETLFGVSRQEIVGQTDFDLFPPDMAAIFAANDQKVLQAGAPLEIEEEAPQNDGLHTYISTKFPLRRASGEIYAVCGLSTDITERKRGEIALQAAKEEAERANRAKSELLSRTSHELRTPLNAILGFGQLLEMDDLSANQSTSVAQILKAGRHQLGLVDRVLDLSSHEPWFVA